MPQFNSYATVSPLVGADKFLIHQASSGAEKTITATTLVSAVEGMIDRVIRYDTIAALIAASVTSIENNSLAYVSGYLAAGDGGGGFFVYNSSSTTPGNGGTVIQPAAGPGRWKRPESATIDVRWFGAMGDDSTNDTTALQDSITAAMGSDSGVGSVYIPAGIYRHSAVLTVPSTPAGNLTIYGDGPNVSILKQTSITTGAISATFDNVGAAQPNRISIIDLGFKTVLGGGTAITVSYGNPAVSNNHSNHGVLIDRVDINSGNGSDAWGTGIDITSAWSCLISNTFISGNSQSGVWTSLAGDAIRMRRYCVNSQITNVQGSFFANFFHWTAEGSGVGDGNTEGLQFSNCTTTAVRRGVYIEGNGSATYPRVSGVTWTGGLMDMRAAIAGFDFVNVQDFMISNTMIVHGDPSGANYGIRCTTCADGAISNIDFFALDYGLYTTGTCRAITIATSVFRGVTEQTHFSSGTTDSRSGTGFVLYDSTRLEVNSGGPSNRIYQPRVPVCRVYRTADQAISAGVETDVIWQAADIEDLEMWDVGNPTRLTPPAGAARVRLTAGVRWEADATGTFRALKIKANNPAFYYPLNSTFAASQQFPDGASAVNGSASISTGIIEVKDIEYFTVTAQGDYTPAATLDVLGRAGAFPSASGGTFFEMEVIE